MPPEEKTTSESDLDSYVFLSNIDVSKSSNLDFKYKCSIPGCNLVFKREVYLDRHEYSHTKIKKYICHYEECEKIYVIKCHLKRHIREFHEKMHREKTAKCTVETCDKMFSSVFSMERHVKNVHNNRKLYECETCSRKFQRKIHLRRHEMTHSGKFPFYCSKCKKGSLKELTRHKCKIHKCEKCDMVFEKWTQVVDHTRLNHPKVNKCQICSLEFNSRTLLKKHKKIHINDDDREVIPCTFENCTRYYASMKSLKAHIKTNHEKVTFPCTYDNCTKKFSYKQHLNKHITKCHKNINQPNPVNSDKSDTKPQKPRKIRNDHGKRRRSMATFLSKIKLDQNLEKKILEGHGDDIILADDIEIPENSQAENPNSIAVVVELVTKEKISE